jgi:hypothetical protein
MIIHCNYFFFYEMYLIKEIRFYAVLVVASRTLPNYHFQLHGQLVLRLLSSYLTNVPHNHRHRRIVLPLILSQRFFIDHFNFSRRVT